MPCRMYSATGTLVRWCSALSVRSCSGVMYTVVEIFLRDMRLAAYDPTWPYASGQTEPFAEAVRRVDHTAKCLPAERLRGARSETRLLQHGEDLGTRRLF